MGLRQMSKGVSMGGHTDAATVSMSRHHYDPVERVPYINFRFIVTASLACLAGVNGLCRV